MNLLSSDPILERGVTTSGARGEGFCVEIALPLLYRHGSGSGNTPFPAKFMVGEDGESAPLPGGIVLGHLQGVHAEDLGAETETLYQELLGSIGERHLIRIWNRVPAIHGKVGGESRYWQFNRGRQNAFSRYFNRSGRWPRFPSATAVGSKAGTPLGIFYLSSPHAPEYFENPCQVPAYEYPKEYGPRAPAFSRGTRLSLPESPYSLYFVSGTSAVIGHRSMAACDLEQQLQITWNNLDIVSREMGLPRELQSGTRLTRLFVVYLRNPADLSHVREFMAARIDQQQDDIIILQADICREELLVEMEVTAIPTALYP